MACLQTHNTVQACVFFGGRCEEAMAFYQTALDAETTAMMRYKDSPDPVPADMLPPDYGDKIMHGSMRIGDTTIMVSDGCGEAQKPDGFSLCVNVDTIEEAEATFAKLLEGGEVAMTLTKTFFSPAFGMLKDAFGVHWMVHTLEQPTTCGGTQPFSGDIEDVTLCLSRVVDATPEAMYRCWTDAALLKPWFCPKPWQVTEAKIDPKPGGVMHVTMQGPDGQEHSELPGCFLELVPNKKIVFTDALGPGYVPNGKPFMTAMVEFEAVEGGTRYTATVLHPSVETKQQHEKMGFADGWAACLDQLVDFCKTL